MKKRWMSILLSLCMVTSLFPAAALAEGTNTCTHTAHDAACGYTDAAEGTPCTHVCDEEVCAAPCAHTHDNSCGYTDATAASPCLHVCSVESGCIAAQTEVTCTCNGTDGDHAEDCLWYEGPKQGALTDEQEAVRLAGHQENPELLTLEDIYAADPMTVEMAPAVFSVDAPNPGSYLITEDNENNAGTGMADGDMDVWQCFTAYDPIEANIVIPEGKLPTQSCFIAVRTYDVNWKGLIGHNSEYDRLYVNGHFVGVLSGLNYDWNTSYYAVPLEFLKEGNNLIQIRMYNLWDKDRFSDVLAWDMERYGEDIRDEYVGKFNEDDYQPSSNTAQTPLLEGDQDSWTVEIDWMQLVCDGGSKEDVSSYQLKLNDAYVSDGRVYVQATTTVSANWKNLHTEYSIINRSGVIVGSYERTGVDSGTHSFTIGMSLSLESGVYTVLGMLKHSDGRIFATDELDFDFTKDVGASLGPQLSHSLNPTVLTNADVTATVTVDDAAGCTNICLDGKAIPDGGLKLTIAENGTHKYEVSFDSIYGEKRTREYAIQVSNIDREKPVITGSNTLAVREGISVTDLDAAIRASFSVSDNRSLEERLEVTVSGTAEATNGGTVTVTAKDEARNTSDVFSIAVSVNPEPALLTISTPANQPSSGADTGTFSLSATMTHTGSKTYTETGFVWGSMSVPTLELNNGAATTTSPVTTKGGTLTATATNIVKGITYYVRAYAKYDGGVLYSDAVPFGLDMPSYGVFGVTGSDNTFTIARTGGSEGAQTVYYRTVNGSAVGGTHFTHTYGTLTFADGETSKTVTVTELGVNETYGSNEATAYSNADRVYFLEIYRVTGGATIDTDMDKATRTMTGAANIDESVYNQKTQTTQSSELEITAAEGFQKVGNSMDLHSSYTADERTYLGALGLQYSYHVSFQVKENKDGYQSIEIVSGSNADSTNVDVEGKNIEKFTTGTIAKFVAIFEHNRGNKETTWGTWTFPEGIVPTESGADDCHVTTKRYDGQNGNYITFPVATQQYITLGADASGTGSDSWYIKNVKHIAQVFDTQEPQLLAVAPMAGGTYLVGDEITVALIFDEIVDSANSGNSIKNVSISTNYGTMAYAGGADTNVLYFTGTVPAGASGPVQVTQINSAQLIKDMCSNTGTNTSGTGSTSITVDTNVPTVAITNATTGSLPSHSATVSASNCQTIQYTWTDNTTLPVAGWQSTADGETLTHNQSSGTKVLHLLATHSNGKAVHVYHSFTFQYPTLTVTQSDPTTWTANKTLTVTPASYSGTISINMEGPQTGTYTGSANVTVTENGTYLFTLTDPYGSVVTARVEVTYIDPVDPTVTIKESGDTTSIHNKLAFAAVAADEGGSGVSKVEYQFTNSTTTPTSGWTTAAEANGQYPMNYIATETAQVTKYLHVKVTDGAGNNFATFSKGYTVIKEPTDADKPAITLTGAPTTWTKGAATLTWTVTKPSTGFTVRDGFSEEPITDTTSGTITATQNGVYYVTVTDSNGYEAQASIAVNCIDTEAPTVASHTVTEGWTQSKTITLNGLSDDNSRIFNADGTPDGYSGSGIASVKWVQGSTWTATGAQEVTGNSFTVTANGDYTVRITDTVGNYADYPVTVAGVDTTAPTVTLSSIPTGWQSTEVTVTVTAGDETGGSGLASVEYALAADNSTAPTSLTPLTSGSSVTVTDGQWYLYYKATDNAGNVTDGWSGLIQVDTHTPTIALTCSDTAEEALTVTVTAAHSGGSGHTVTVAKNGGTPAQVSGTTYQITEPGAYTFTVTTGAGKSASNSITVHQVTLDSANGAAEATLLVKSGGTVTQPTDPTYEGYTFQKWNDGSAAWDFAGTVSADLTLTAKWALNAPTANLAADRNDITYDGGNVTLTATPGHTLDGLTYTYQWHKGTDTLANTAATLTLKDVADSGTYTVTITAKDSAGRFASATSSALTVSIAPKDISGAVITLGAALTYNGSVQTQSVASVVIDGLDVSYDISGNTGTDAKGYTLTVTGTGNFTGTATMAWTIAPKAVTIVCDNASKVYGDSDPALTGTVTGVVPGDDLNVTYSRAAGEDKGEYVISAAYTANTDYSVTATGGTFTITARAVTVTVTAASKVYGTENPTFQWTVSDGSIVNGDDLGLGLSCAATNTSPVGSYDVTGDGTYNENYTVTIEGDNKLTVTNATLTGVSVGQSGTLTYSGVDQTAAVTTAATAVNDQRVTFTYSAAEDGTYSENVPAFQIAGDHTVWYKASAPNHSTATGRFTVHIDKAALTVTAEDKSMVVGGTVPAYTVQCEGLQNDETAADIYTALPTAACPADGKTAGEYAITASGAETLANYAVTYVAGQLRVDPLTVTFNANGGEGEPEDLTVSNAATSLPANPFTRKDHTFAGWNTASDGTGLSYTDGAVYVPTGEDVTLYAQWTEKAKYTVGGTALEDGTPTAGVTVSLCQGNTVLASTTTDANGRFLFSNVTDGAYNLVARDSDRVTTVLKDVTENVNDIVLDLPDGTVSSRLTIEEPSDDTVQTAIQPDSIVVGSLNDEAEAQANDPGTPADAAVTVTMTVAPKTEADAKAEDDHTQAEQEAAAELKEAMDTIRQVSGASGKTMEYLEITVVKTVNDGEPVEISETAHVLEIVIPFRFADRLSITVYRYHDGAAEALTRLTGKPAADYEDGSYWLDRDNGLIYVYARKYSLYSVGYVVPYYPPAYTLTLPESTPGGTVTTNSIQPSTGSTVTLTVTPDEGYEVGTLTVTDSKGNVLPLTDKGDGKYTFTMPGGKVSVQVVFARIRCDGGADCPSRKFTDLDPTLWYHEGIDFVLDQGMMKGTGDGTVFSPYMTTSRAMIATILWRLEGSPVVNYLMQFEDVAEGAWYSEAVRWAATNGIVEGYNGKFLPDASITREQLAAMLWRYAKYKGYDVSVGESTNILSYPDAFDASEWAIPALQWACGEGIITNKAGSLAPGGDASRTEAAAMLMRFVDTVKN